MSWICGTVDSNRLWKQSVCGLLLSKRMGNLPRMRTCIRSIGIWLRGWILYWMRRRKHMGLLHLWVLAWAGSLNRYRRWVLSLPGLRFRADFRKMRWNQEKLPICIQAWAVPTKLSRFFRCSRKQFVRGHVWEKSAADLLHLFPSKRNSPRQFVVQKGDFQYTEQKSDLLYKKVLDLFLS